MPKYRVWGTVKGSIYLGEVEAKDADEAIWIAICKNHVSFCHRCSSRCEDPQITSAEAEEIQETGDE